MKLWKSKLKNLEHERQWDEAINFMENVIRDNPENKDAYIFMNYLLMNLLVEETYDRSKDPHYEKLAKWYFEESYAKFKNDPEYLYLVGRTAGIAHWYFGIDEKDFRNMINKALELEPDNLLYQEPYYWSLEDTNHSQPQLIAYAKKILAKDSPINQQLKNKGAVGKYLIELLHRWCNQVLYNARR